ncbi:hypothetical protein CVS40_8438 [Lucilia cuprina]|nr:hypothetical protein CVS40_8438 [Lucilia cuprina]
MAYGKRESVHHVLHVSIINSCSQFAYEHAQKIIDNPEEEFDNERFPELLMNGHRMILNGVFYTCNKLLRN